MNFLAKKLDIIGNKYGDLTVIEEVDRTKNSRKFICKCSCGNEIPILMRHLRSGHKTSCGCKNKNVSRKRSGMKLNLIGDKYGKLTVMQEVAQKGKERQFICQCDCGESTVTSMSALRCGNTSSCGCIKSASLSTLNSEDLTNLKFGRLKVLRKSNKKNEKNPYIIYWEVKCECGKEKTVLGQSLKNGTTRSCGCLRGKIKRVKKRVDSRRIDLTGQQFGDLIVKALSSRRGNNNTLLWRCKCSCGKTVYLHSFSLVHGHNKSCGCKRDAKRDQGLMEHIKRDTIDGTRISALNTKLHSANKSGHKGVRFNTQRNKWTAHIGFKGKQISLGYFSDKEDAIAARKKAEEKYFKPILEDKNNEGN